MSHLSSVGSSCSRNYFTIGMGGGSLDVCISVVFCVCPYRIYTPCSRRNISVDRATCSNPHVFLSLCMNPIPVLPGNPIPRNSDQHSWLKGRLADLCGVNHDRSISPSRHLTQLTCSRFPGSQPVSFSSKDLERLEHEE